MSKTLNEALEGIIGQINTVYATKTENSTKQDLLPTNGNTDNVLTINSNGDYVWQALKSNVAFNSSWPVSKGSSIADFCAAIVGDSTVQPGMTFTGSVACTGLPVPDKFNKSLSQAEILVQVFNASGQTGRKNKVIHLDVYSADSAPYHWTRTYWEGNGTGNNAFNADWDPDVASTWNALSGKPFYAVDRIDFVNSSWDGYTWTGEYAPQSELYYDDGNNQDGYRYYKLTEILKYDASASGDTDFNFKDVIYELSGQIDENTSFEKRGTFLECIKKVLDVAATIPGSGITEDNKNDFAVMIAQNITVSSGETFKDNSSIKKYQVAETVLGMGADFLVALEDTTFTDGQGNSHSLEEGVYALVNVTGGFAFAPIKCELVKKIERNYMPESLDSDINNLDLRVNSLENGILHLEIKDEDWSSFLVAALGLGEFEGFRFYKLDSDTKVQYTELKAAFMNGKRVSLKTSYASGTDLFLISTDKVDNLDAITVGWMTCAVDDASTTSDEGQVSYCTAVVWASDEDKNEKPNQIYMDSITAAPTEIYSTSSIAQGKVVRTISSIASYATSKRIICWKDNIVVKSEVDRDSNDIPTEVRLYTLNTNGYTKIKLTKYSDLWCNYSEQNFKYQDNCDKTTAGTYVYQCVVDEEGNQTYSWVKIATSSELIGGEY